MRPIMSPMAARYATVIMEPEAHFASFRADKLPLSLEAPNANTLLDEPAN